MAYAISNLLERPANEPVLTYAPGSAERAALKAAIADLCSHEIEIPLIIGDPEVRKAAAEALKRIRGEEADGTTR
jgi:hypothetical protein